MVFSMVLIFSPLNWKLFLQETGSKLWVLLCFAASPPLYPKTLKNHQKHKVVFRFSLDFVLVNLKASPFGHKK